MVMSDWFWLLNMTCVVGEICAIFAIFAIFSHERPTIFLLKNPHSSPSVSQAIPGHPRGRQGRTDHSTATHPRPTHLGQRASLKRPKSNWLVVSTPLKNISQLGWLFPIYGKIKNVPNHQPGNSSYRGFWGESWWCSSGFSVHVRDCHKMFWDFHGDSADLLRIFWHLLGSKGNNGRI